MRNWMLSLAGLMVAICGVAGTSHAAQTEAQEQPSHEQLIERINELEEQVVVLEAEVERLQVIENRLAILEKLIASQKTADKGNATNATSSDNVIEEPKYRYKYNLVWDKERYEVREKNNTGGYDVKTRTETDKTRIGVRMFFKNEDTKPMRFEIEIDVFSKQRVANRPETKELLGKGVERTPMLEPDEVYEFTKWIPVDDSRRVKTASLANVKGYLKPAE